MGALSLAVIGLSAISGGLQAAQQNALSERQGQVQEQVYRENRDASIKARDLSQEQDALQTRRHVEEIAGNRLDTAIKALKTMEATKTAAGEAGVGGQGTAILTDSSYAAGLRQDTSFTSMLKDLQTNSNLTAKGADATMTSRINSVARGTVVKQNIFGNALTSALGTGTSLLISKKIK